MNLLTKFPIGQYVDGNKSWLKIIDSRLKLIILSIFLLTPIWSGPIWRISLVFCLVGITFFSFIPLRVWWRPFIILIVLSLIIGLLSIFASSSFPALEIPFRDPKELNLVLENKNNWNILEIPIKKWSIFTFGPFFLSNKAFELGIKTSTLIFTLVQSVNLILLTTLKEDLVWALSWFMNPFSRIGFPINKWLFQLLLALRFIPLVQEEFQNIIKSASIRSINFRKLGFKNSVDILFSIVERLFLNIFLRIEQGADSLVSKRVISLNLKKFKPLKGLTLLSCCVNSLAVFFICVAIFLRKQYGSL
ncbi:MAG: cobalt ABC transporter permease [Prochlorococcus sp. SP3034]|nr:cobalt ABC transporter permease [Prochlorococcus sp. SP3034]|tara:strand:+ start:3909 stop:4823 length:915 start_codon:yes stop_codon:yes gene_type:complete